jgi:hypothetical protein
MSTMLRTTNPAAVDEIDPGKDRRRAYVGQTVIYHGRPGEARMGKLSTPALVVRVEDDDHIEIIVRYAAEDALDRWKVPRRTEQNPFNCWSFNEWEQDHYDPDKPGISEAPPATGTSMSWADVKDMRSEMTEMRSRIAALEGKHKGAK